LAAARLAEGYTQFDLDITDTPRATARGGGMKGFVLGAEVPTVRRRHEQKQKTNDAEGQALGHTSFTQSTGFGDLARLMALIADTPWWVTQRGVRPAPQLVAHVASARKTTSMPDSGLIMIGPGMYTVEVLCHSLAHLIEDGYTAEFRGVLVELVRLAGGEAPAQRLAHSYMKFGLGVADTPRAVVRSGGLGGFILDTPMIRVHNIQRWATLLGQAESARRAEAGVLHGKAAKLAHMHGIDVSRLAAMRRKHGANFTSRLIRVGAGAYAPVRTELLYVVARGYPCSLRQGVDRGGQVTLLLGHRDNLHKIEMLFRVLDRQAQREMLMARPEGNVLQWQRAFLKGFAAGVENTNVQRQFDKGIRKDHPQRNAAALGAKAGRRAALRLGAETAAKLRRI